MGNRLINVILFEVIEMEVLQIESLGLFIELSGPSINIEGTNKFTLEFKNEILANFWFESLKTQMESLDEFII